MQRNSVYAVIFNDRQLEIFERYKKELGFRTSADAYRSLIDLVTANWDGTNLKHNHKSALKFSPDEYEAMEAARKKLGGVSRGEVFRRGIKFLHNTLYNGKEFERWKKIAAEKPFSDQIGSRFKQIVYSVNDIENEELMEVCEAYGEGRGFILRLGFEAVKTLPAEMFPKNEPGRNCFTVRLGDKEAERLERLKESLNVGGNEIFRMGVLLAERLLEGKDREDKKAALEPISLQSEIVNIKCPLSLDSAKRDDFLEP